MLDHCIGESGFHQSPGRCVVRLDRACWPRVRSNNNAERPARSGLAAIVFRTETGDRLCQLAGKRIKVSWRLKSHFRFESKGSHQLTCLFGLLSLFGHLPDHSGGRRDQVSAGVPVRDCFRVGRESFEEFRTNNEGSRGDPDQAFETTSTHFFFDQLNEAGIFELAKVIVDFLPGNSEAPGQP